MDTKRVGQSTTPVTTPLDRAQDIKQAKAIQSQKANKKPEGIGAKQDFAVNLSPQAREMAEAREKAMRIAKNTPEIREDRVKELKERIQNGTYKIDSGAIADGIMKEAIRDHLATMPDE